MAPKHEESLTGKTFEKCRILAKLGTGGMGSVWLAEHFGLGRKVAVKILPPEMGRDPEYVARFMREATTAGRMEHPNIVQIHDVGYAEGRHFIVMQYVDGESLSTVVENLGAMEPRDAAKIAAGILRGLQHAHEEGVVHRDVKPDNVLIAKGDEPKILDFGLAIETETALQITKDGMVVGTPYYLAPEQARGQKATPLCDVYASGVTLYYLLTGKRPFVGATALAVLNKHIHEAPVPPMKHKSDIPRALNDIVLKMMAKKPVDRYQSAGAAAADLEAFLKGKPIDVRVPLQLPFKLPFDVPPLTRRQWTAVAAAAGSAFLLLIVLIVALSVGKPKTEAVVKVEPGKTVAVPDERAKLEDCLQFERDHKNDVASIPKVFERYDFFVRASPSAELTAKAKDAMKTFHEFIEKHAQEELDKAIKEADPVRRLKALEDFPQVLVDYTSIDKRLREERGLAHAELESAYLEDERKLDAALSGGVFKEAAALLDRLLRIAEGPRRQRLERIKAELPRMEREFDDAVLRRLARDYVAVHQAFEESLIKRENAAAYTRVTKFLRELTDDAERSRARVPQGVNYDAVLSAVPDAVLTDSRLGQIRTSLAGAFTRAQDALPYRILADLQDALDVEFLIRSAKLGLDELLRSNGDVRLATFNATGRVSFGATGYQFSVKGAPSRNLSLIQLQPQDLVQLAAAAEKLTIERVYESNEQLSRAAGAAYLYSLVPERWSQAARWFRRAEELGLPGLGFRLEGFRERGYKEVRDRIALSRKELDRKNFEGAKAPLAGVEAAWSHDALLKSEIGRAMAAILTAELASHERARDQARVKQTARTLRANYLGLYPDETVFAPYAHALRVTGDWRPAGNLMNDDWTWEGKAQGAEAPAEDQTKSGRGLRLKPDRTIELSPAKSRTATGASVELSVASAYSSFSVGFRFDASSKDGRYRKIVVRDTGEVALYECDGHEEKRKEFASLGKKLAPGQWIELAYVAEGGDLVCYVDQRPMFLVPAAVPTDREIGLWTSADANFRLLRLRK